MYTLTGVRKTYANSFMAVRDIDLHIGAGERVALIGPSGAGKTTLFRLLNCTLRPSAGTITIGTIDSTTLHGKRLQRLRRSIGTIYQQHNLVPRLRVMHNVLAGHLGRWSVARAFLSLVYPQELDTAVTALQRVGLADRLFQRTDQLSGGEQQRVAIARVLVQNPSIILADEPVASLDPALSESIVRLLIDLADRQHKTLLVSLHNVKLAMEYFPRVLVLQHGRLVFDGKPQTLSPALLQNLFADIPANPGSEKEVYGRSHIPTGCRFPT